MTRFLLGVIACLVVVLFTREGCNGAVINRLKNQPVAAAKTDTAWRHDTVHIPAYMPRSYKRVAAAKVSGPVDRGEMVQPCSDLVLYRDTVVFQYGNVVLNDQVQNNQIISRQPTWTINVPVVREPARKRNEFYAGINAAYRMDSVAAFGPSLMLKTKRDKVYEASAMLDSRGKLMIGAGVKFKISLK